MAKVKKKKQGSPIMTLILLLILVGICTGGIFAISHFSKSLGDVSIMQVKVNGKKLDTDSEIICNVGDTLRFDTSYIFLNKKPEIDNYYTIKILPANDCDLIINGDGFLSFYTEGELTECFNIKYDDTSFSIPINSNLISEIVKPKYGDNVTTKGDINTFENSYISIEIYNYKNELTYTYYLKIYQDVEGVEMEGGVIIG